MYAKCPKCRTCYGSGQPIVRAGRFYRKSDSRWISRFHCRSCKTHFSQATADPCYRQNKRRLNHLLYKDLTCGVSMRECARKFGIHRTTIDRKKRFLAIQAKLWLAAFRNTKAVYEMQFDDMETFEHTKCKPLSITLSVEEQTRLILGFKVSRMPAKGLLVRRSIKKYGKRADERRRGRHQLFCELKPCIAPNAIINSDQNPHYEPDVRKFFPNAKYQTFKGMRGCVVGQGELEGGGFDPLFSLNHTAAMLRANINRLFRRTWCTTKKVEGLEDHIAIYARSHNQRILEKLNRQK